MQLINPYSKQYAVYLYVIYAPGDNRLYIGKTVNPAGRRDNHIYDLRRNNHHNPGLQNLFHKNTKLIMQVIGVAKTDRVALSFESHLVNTYKFWHDILNIAGTPDHPSAVVPCFWNGIRYDSISSMSNALGIKMITASRRLASGTVGDGIALDGLHRPMCFWEGVMYEDISQAAFSNGINGTVMNYFWNMDYTRVSHVLDGEGVSSIGDLNRIWSDAKGKSVYGLRKADYVYHELLEDHVSFDAIPENASVYVPANKRWMYGDRA